MTNIQFSELKKLLQPKEIFTQQITLASADVESKLGAGLRPDAKIVKIFVWFIGAGTVTLNGAVVAETSVVEDKVIQIDAPAGTYFQAITTIVWSGAVAGVSVSWHL